MHLVLLGKLISNRTSYFPGTKNKNELESTPGLKPEPKSQRYVVPTGGLPVTLNRITCGIQAVLSFALILKPPHCPNKILPEQDVEG